MSVVTEYAHLAVRGGAKRSLDVILQVHECYDDLLRRRLAPIRWLSDESSHVKLKGGMSD